MGQNVEEIEALIDKGDSAYLKMNYKLVMENSVASIEKSKSIAYEKGIVKGNCYISLILNYLEEYGKSFKYVKMLKNIKII